MGNLQKETIPKRGDCENKWKNNNDNEKNSHFH